MSVMSSQRRKLFVGPKPKSDRTYVKGDYMKWLNGAKAQLEKLFIPKGYLRHSTHSRDMRIAINQARNVREDQRLAERNAA